MKAYLRGGRLDWISSASFQLRRKRDLETHVLSLKDVDGLMLDLLCGVLDLQQLHDLFCRLHALLDSVGGALL